MSSYGNDPQQYERKRRVERYAGEFLNEPSMSAAQPLPEKPGKQTARTSRVNAAMHDSASMPAVDAAQHHPAWTQPQQPAGNAGWAQPYAAAQPVQNAGWSQPYPAAQPVQNAGWSQPYPAQPVQNAGWSQPYPAQPAQDPAWSQPQPVQPPVQNAGWSQPYPPQQWQGTNGYTPPPGTDARIGRLPEAEYGGSDGGNPGNPTWKLALVIVVIVLIIAAAVAGATALSRSSALHNEVSAYNDRFCEGVYVDGIHLGGMTQDEARQAVEKSAQARLDAWSVRLEYGGGLIRKITAGDLGMTVNVENALEDAWNLGHASSDVRERKAAMDQLLEEPYYGYSALPSGDTSAIDAILFELASVVYQPAQDAYFSGFNKDAHSYPFEIVPEKLGHILYVDDIKEEIYALVDNMQSGSVQVEPQILRPAVTEADLRQQRVLRGSATTEISTMSTEGRTANIQRAFELSNGKVLRPGESYSFNTVVGARSKANGFHLAIEYAYGQEREGYGGGVCQASTTIYLAAMRANMTVTKREPHSDKVNYTEYGLDATVNLDGKKIDLVFKNTTGSDVYILTYLERSGVRWICKVDIWGEPHEEGVTYDLVAQTVEVLAPPADPEYVKDEKGTHVVYIDEMPVQKRAASEGYVVETYKVKYLNGEAVEQTFVARDTYKAKSQQLWVGVSERDDVWIP